MNNKIIPEAFHPGEYIRDELEAREWTQIDLATIIGLPPNIVSDIITGRRTINAEIATALSEAFVGTTAQVWLNLQSAYQLAMETTNKDVISRRAKLFEKAPIREMQKRGWIEKTTNIDILETQICKFYDINSIDDEIEKPNHAARKSDDYENLTPPQLAWLTQAKRLANSIEIEKPYNKNNFSNMIDELARLKINTNGLLYISDTLSKFGVRFLILEHLPKSKIDGAVFWLDEKSPVIVLSLRYDRIDSFWFSLAHELGHIKNKDGLKTGLVEIELFNDDSSSIIEKPKEELEADKFAVNFLVNQSELDTFVENNRPIYSKRNITLFSARLEIHPGIVVGQLQPKGRNEIPYSNFRAMLVKVRELITKYTLTDGWGRKVVL